MSSTSIQLRTVRRAVGCPRVSGIGTLLEATDTDVAGAREPALRAVTSPGPV